MTNPEPLGLKRHDTPRLVARLGAQLGSDITGATVVFSARPLTGDDLTPTILDGAGFVLDGPNRLVAYQSSSGDWDVDPGFYLCEFEITLSGSKTTFPGRGSLVVEVGADVNDG